MPRQGEIEYLKSIGAERARHALGKPFSDANCGTYLTEVGAFISLLPPPPRRLLDLACGTGWTSVFFAKMGYDVTALDLAPDMIAAAEINKSSYGVDNISFSVGDYENLTYDNEFDCVTIYDALHHAEDELAVLRGAYRALKPGGGCVTSEPGRGHTKNPITINAVAEHNVTERDMPPATIVAAGRAAGFTSFKVYPRPVDIRRDPLRLFKWLVESTLMPRRNGYVVLTK
jgi:ubiquinone/menaquinone biosynthesis C-methylase UbiE